MFSLAAVLWGWYTSLLVHNREHFGGLRRNNIESFSFLHGPVKAAFVSFRQGIELAWRAANSTFDPVLWLWVFFAALGDAAALNHTWLPSLVTILIVVLVSDGYGDRCVHIDHTLPLGFLDWGSLIADHLRLMFLFRDTGVIFADPFVINRDVSRWFRRYSRLHNYILNLNLFYSNS